MLRRFAILLGLGAIACLMPATKAYAYLDPATGSMILQAIVGGVVAGLVAIKLYWSKFVRLFKRDKEAKE